MSRYELLGRFFERIKTLGFWDRLFRWGAVRTLSYEAYEEFRNMAGDSERSSKAIEVLESRKGMLETELKNLDSRMQEARERLVKAETEKVQGDATAKGLEREVNELKKDNQRLLQENDSRLREHQKAMVQFQTAREAFERYQKELHDKQIEAQRERFEALKKTWSDHEAEVERRIRKICEQHLITYVEEWPFKGKPDNAVQIIDEYVVFDAKSPSSEDLGNFPDYIKVQAGQAKKYAQLKGVRRDIFLVIPSNTVEVIDHQVYPMADYDVYVISLDSLEPILLALRRIEDYEEVAQLSPEERENISRIIGKFLHLTKRRVQIDQFFVKRFFELWSKSGEDLPDDMVQMALDYEKADLINPTPERRSKQISARDLEARDEALNAEATQVHKLDIPGSIGEVKGLG